MGIEERGSGSQNVDNEIEIQFQQELEDLIQNGVILLRIMVEQGYAAIVAKSQAMTKNYPPFVKEHMARFAQNIIRSTSTEQSHEARITRVIEEISDPDKRKAIRIKGLEAARQDWEQQLRVQDIQTSVIMRGRARITRISARIEEMTGHGF